MGSNPTLCPLFQIPAALFSPEKGFSVVWMKAGIGPQVDCDPDLVEDEPEG